MRISDWSSDVCASDLKNEPYEEQSQQRCTQRYGEQLEPPPAPHIPEKGGHATRIPLQLEPQIRLFGLRSEEHTSELQSLMRISYAVFCLKKKKKKIATKNNINNVYTQHNIINK